MADAAKPDLFAEEVRPERIPFDVWVDGLPEWQRKQFLERAADRAVSHAGMIRVVESLGRGVNKDTISKWRKDHGFKG